MRRLIAVLLLVCTGAASGAERIEHFQSDVKVLADGAVEVIETITVHAEGKRIQRGIYRDFPTVYRDRLNHRVQVRFDVIGVRRNGKPEPWFEKPIGNGVRVYVGREGVLIAGGRHTYEITYRSNRQIGFFEAHDELYWNVTGNDWAFAIEAVEAYVYLPRTVPGRDITVEAYTGRLGARGDDYEAGVDDEGVAWFRSTRTFDPGEGLTLVTAWPKGHVRPPTGEEKLDWFLEDNAHVLAGVLGTLLLLTYYLLAWFAVGRDPQAGVLVALYDPPQAWSPAAMRYVRRMGYDNRCFTAALVNLAVKGVVEIAEDDGTFTIRHGRHAAPAPLAPGEAVLRDRLLDGGPLVLERSSHSRVRRAVDAHRLRLDADYEKNYFVLNRGFTLFGLLLSLLVLGSSVVWSNDGDDLIAAAFMLVWLTGWSFGTFALLSKAVAAWRHTRGLAGRGAAIVLSLFALPFVGGWFVGAGMLARTASVATVVLLLCLVGTNFLFYRLMKAPTARGRAMLDEVEGFREYLAVAEADELRLINPPRRTPQLFERYLPYAIALDVEDVWGERFESVLAAARRDGTYAGPQWYHGSRSFSPASLASSVGAGLAAGVAASSRAPGSSSGSGGGGSSGGGGGGGGGGGW